MGDKFRYFCTCIDGHTPNGIGDDCCPQYILELDEAHVGEKYLFCIYCGERKLVLQSIPSNASQAYPYYKLVLTGYNHTALDGKVTFSQPFDAVQAAQSVGKNLGLSVEVLCISEQKQESSRCVYRYSPGKGDDYL